MNLAVIATLLSSAPFSVYAASDAAAPASPSATSLATSDTMSEGEIGKVDKDAKKITIKHGELKKLEMPAMTMVFQVKDSALLDKVK